jgi:hypothetical protein
MELDPDPARGTLAGMNKQVAIRRVRIAASVFFGVLTVLLVVLWVRSFFWMDFAVHQGPYRQVISGCGDIYIRISSLQVSDEFEGYWKFASQRIKLRREGWLPRLPKIWRDRAFTYISLPHWSLASAGVALTIIPLVPFSRRR